MAGLGPRAVLAAVAVGSQCYLPCLTCSCTCSLMIVDTTDYGVQHTCTYYAAGKSGKQQAARTRAGAAAPGPNTAWSFLASLSWRFQGAAGFNSAILQFCNSAIRQPLPYISVWDTPKVVFEPSLDARLKAKSSACDKRRCASANNDRSQPRERRVRAIPSRIRNHIKSA